MSYFYNKTILYIKQVISKRAILSIGFLSGGVFVVRPILSVGFLSSGVFVGWGFCRVGVLSVGVMSVGVLSCGGFVGSPIYQVNAGGLIYQYLCPLTLPYIIYNNAI